MNFFFHWHKTGGVIISIGLSRSLRRGLIEVFDMLPITTKIARCIPYLILRRNISTGRFFVLTKVFKLQPSNLLSLAILSYVADIGKQLREYKCLYYKSKGEPLGITLSIISNISIISRERFQILGLFSLVLRDKLKDIFVL